MANVAGLSPTDQPKNTFLAYTEPEQMSTHLKSEQTEPVGTFA
jgi:hypothetical protein